MRNKKGQILEALDNKVARIILVILSLVLLFFSLKLGIDSLAWKSERNDNVLYSYNINKGYTYGVNLTPNEFITENPQGMNELYISSLVNNFDVTMNYSYSASKQLNLKYSYKINSSIVGEYNSSPNGEKAEVWVQEFPIVNPVEETLENSNTVNISEKFTLDFHYYDDYVKRFMQTIGITIDAYLKVEMEVTIDGELEDGMNTLHDTQTVTMNIPLNEDVFAVTGETEKTINENIAGINTYVDKVDPVKLTIALAMLAVSIGILVFVLRSLFRNVKKKDEYTSQKDKILKQYGDIIVETASPIDFQNYQVVEIKNFNEMIDLEEELHTPILFYEPEPNETSWFMLIQEKVLYRYVLKRKGE